MSSTLYWRPEKVNGKDLSDELKYALRKRFGDPVSCTLDDDYPEDIAYIQALCDTGVEDAEKLLEAIEKHDRIIIEEQF